MKARRGKKEGRLFEPARVLKKEEKLVFAKLLP